MDVLLMIIYATLVLGFLVFIHEGGHYLASRAFGVRVTEFMLGLPGPSVGFTKAGTRFGVTAVPLGGYAKVCGMEAGEMSPHLQQVLAALYRRGTANMEDIARDCGITDEEAYDALDQLAEWGSVIAPLKADQFNTYRAPATKPTKKQIKAALTAAYPAPQAFELGQARPVDNETAFFQSEYKQQYRSLPFWKRTVILVAGAGANLLFAVLAFVLIYSVIGIEMQHAETGELVRRYLSPLQAIQAGFGYIGMVIQLVANLFNPATAAETVSNSASVMGIAVMSKTAADQGLLSFIFFTANISISLGVMNLLPIPPLDGGRFVIELFQKITRKIISPKALNYLSAGGMMLFIGFFLVMVNQDIQRFVFGNWG